MLVHCSNTECSTQFADDLRACPSCRSAIGEPVMFSSQSSRRYSRFKRYTLLLAVPLLIFLAFELTTLQFSPFDDGPFHGCPTSPVNGRQPDQSTPIWGACTLEVYDPRQESDSAIVQLRRSDGSVQWSIFADGHDSGDVRSVRLTSVHRRLMRTGAVRGEVDWAYGREACIWFITGNGNLRDYYYSW